MTTFFTDADFASAGEFVEPEVWLAERYTVAVDGTAFFGWRWPAIAPLVTPVIRVYTAAGALVAGPISFDSTTLGTINPAGQASPVALTAGTYDVVVNTNRYPAIVGFHSGGPVVRGQVTGIQGRFGPTGTPPASTSTAAYGPNIDFTAAGSGDKTSSATHTATVSLTGISSGGTATAQEVTGMGVAYTTRERVMRAADIKATAYRNSEVDAAIEAASRRIDSLCRRGDATRPGFAPWTGTIAFDWPSQARGNVGSSFRLWLSPHSLLSLSAASSGGTTITSNTYGWPGESGAPYPAVAIDRGSNSTLQPGNSAGQRSTSITGVWSAALADERGRTNWTLGASASSSTGTLTVNAPFEVGQLLRIGDERLIVNDRLWATSGQTGSLTASMAAQSLAVSDGTVFFPGEELILEAERVWVRDVVGNTLIVQRAVSGSVLAAHTSVAIQWSRTALCERGVLGTTAAAHASADRVWFAKFPMMIEQLATAYAIDQRAQETAAYARTSGSGDNERPIGKSKSIVELEAAVLAAYGKQLGHRAV